MGLADAAEPFVVVRLIYRSVSPRLGPTLDDDEKRLRVVKSCLKSKGGDRSDAGVIRRRTSASSRAASSTLCVTDFN